MELLREFFYALLPLAEATTLCRQYFPFCRPNPPPFFLDERFTDRLSSEDLQALCEVTRALGWNYREVQRYLRVFCCVDSLRLERVSLRQVCVAWHIKHTPFVDCIFSNVVKPDEAPQDDVEASSSFQRIFDATRLFVNIYDFCSLSESELLMFVLHSCGIHEPSDVPTPSRFIQRLIYLVHGSHPSEEIIQLHRCLRCLPAGPLAVVKGMVKGNESYSTKHGRDSGTDGEYKDHNCEISEGQFNRSVSHNDFQGTTVAERWCECCEILLRFPIFIQPAIALQKALRRKTLGESFWKREGCFRRILPLESQRVALPPLTAARILAARDAMQSLADKEHHSNVLKKYFIRAPDAAWVQRRVALEQGNVACGSECLDPLWMLGSGYEEWCGLKDDSRPFLWPPAGLVAEALVGAATSSPNHAWFLSSSNLLLMVVNRDEIWTRPKVSLPQLQSSSDVLSASENFMRGKAKDDSSGANCRSLFSEGRRQLLMWYLAHDGERPQDNQAASDSSSSSVRFEEMTTGGSEDTVKGATNFHQQARDSGLSNAFFETSIKSLGDWFELSLLSSDMSNVMLNGTWNISKMKLSARETMISTRNKQDYDEEGDKTDIAWRIKAETAAGAKPGVAAPQPFSPLFALPEDLTSESSMLYQVRGRNLAGEALGWSRELKTEKDVSSLYQELARMTRSYNFSQFIMATAALRRDQRLVKSLSQVYENKDEPFDQKFWQSLSSEEGAYADEKFYFNVRTGVRTWMKPTFIRTKEKRGDPPYIRVW